MLGQPCIRHLLSSVQTKRIVIPGTFHCLPFHSLINHPWEEEVQLIGFDTEAGKSDILCMVAFITGVLEKALKGNDRLEYCYEQTCTSLLTKKKERQRLSQPGKAKEKRVTLNLIKEGQTEQEGGQPSDCQKRKTIASEWIVEEWEKGGCVYWKWPESVLYMSVFLKSAFSE